MISTVLPSTNYDRAPVLVRTNTQTFRETFRDRAPEYMYTCLHITTHFKAWHLLDPESESINAPGEFLLLLLLQSRLMLSRTSRMDGMTPADLSVCGLGFRV